MKYLLVFLFTSGSTPPYMHAYSMPDKQTCIEALEAARINNPNEADGAVIAFCRTDEGDPLSAKP